ncbi:MAG TPA: Mur ligase domain-containing protein, partial [Opitutales bacterium]|nr:Mur ligase domain-containing protein [Opitutales bacterium]
MISTKKSPYSKTVVLVSFIETPERSFLFCLPDTGIEAQFMHHVYFMGIGGTAMGSVAILLKQKGYRVSGSDQNLYPPMSDRLREAGIEAWEGYDAAHLAIAAPDLVVVGNVIGRGNPEAEWLLEQRSLRFVSLPELIRSHLIG